MTQLLEVQTVRFVEIRRYGLRVTWNGWKLRFLRETIGAVDLGWESESVHISDTIWDDMFISDTFNGGRVWVWFHHKSPSLFTVPPSLSLAWTCLSNLNCHTPKKRVEHEACLNAFKLDMNRDESIFNKLRNNSCIYSIPLRGNDNSNQASWLQKNDPGCTYPSFRIVACSIWFWTKTNNPGLCLWHLHLSTITKKT